jgi:hypothetical protein
MGTDPDDPDALSFPSGVFLTDRRHDLQRVGRSFDRDDRAEVLDAKTHAWIV